MRLTRHLLCYAWTDQVSLKSLVKILQSCGKIQDFFKGKQTHALMLVNGHLESPVSATSLINMYSKCNSIADAVSVFHATTRAHNVFVYNSIIAGLADNGLQDKAYEFYVDMRAFGLVPDKFTFPSVIKVCPTASELRNIHGLLFKLELCDDLFIGSSLLHSYLKFELMGDAMEVFDNLPVRDDVVLWNTMINGFVQIGDFDKSLGAFRTMTSIGCAPSRFTVTGILSALALSGDTYNGRLVHGFALKKEFVSLTEVSNSLIDMYGKGGRLAYAIKVFDAIVEKDMYSWNSIINVHQQCGDYGGTMKLFKRMLGARFSPDLVTITGVLPACSQLAALRHGKEIHGYIIINCFHKSGGAYFNNGIMDMYAKCGSMREARLIFDAMEFKDIASWNIMVLGYGMHGFGDEALHLFSHMCEEDSRLKPDSVSYVGVLAACSHAGFLARGRQFLAQMQEKHSVTPQIEHYACVVDMLGRAGQLEEALELLSNMPIEPNQVTWRAFLAACRLHGNAELSEIAARRVLELEPNHCGNYVLMSNVYGAAGKFEQVAELRFAMREHEVKKSPGCSWIESSDGCLRIFFNNHHPQECSASVYDRLDSLTLCLREHGSAFVSLDVLESCL